MANKHFNQHCACPISRIMRALANWSCATWAPQFDLGLDNLTEEQLHNDPKEDREAQSIKNHGDDGSDGSNPLLPSALLATLLMPAHSSTTPGPFPPNLAPVPATPSVLIDADEFYGLTEDFESKFGSPQHFRWNKNGTK